MNFLSEQKIVKIIIISGSYKDKFIHQFFGNNIFGYLTKDSDKQEVLKTITDVSKGKKIYCDHIIDFIVNEKANATSCEPKVLTKREIEISN